MDQTIISLAKNNASSNPAGIHIFIKCLLHAVDYIRIGYITKCLQVDQIKITF